MKLPVLFILFAYLFLYPPLAVTDQNEPSTGCRAVAAGVGAMVGFRSLNPVGSMTTMLNVGLAAAGAVVGDQSLSESCQDLADTFVDHMEIIGNSMSEVDYEEFVDEHCGGQPLACAPLNIDCGPTSCDPFIPPNPWECLTKIDCGVNQLSANMSSGFSMDNIANAIIFTDISQSAGSWQYENYGHLIGIDPGHNPPGHNDPY